MKTKILLLIALCCAVTFTSCKKDDDPQFKYPLETIYGTWDGTSIYVDDKWVDITKSPYTQFAFSIRFYSDGKYSGSGYFGNGSGTYKAIGNTIITYVDGEEYARYDVISLTNDLAELTMSMGTSSLKLRAKKK